MENKKVLKVRHYKIGYEVRTEEFCFDGECYTMKSAYTNKGDYIGNSRWAYRLYYKYGIIPEKINPEDNVCSIGFCGKEQKWYGWSHRAMYGFGIGDVVKEGDCTASSGWSDAYLAENPEKDRSLPIGFVAKTLEDAKKMAIAFADNVA